jgi:hypothetical protein
MSDYKFVEGMMDVFKMTQREMIDEVFSKGKVPPIKKPVMDGDSIPKKKKVNDVGPDNMEEEFRETKSKYEKISKKEITSNAYDSISESDEQPKQKEPPRKSMEVDDDLSDLEPKNKNKTAEPPTKSSKKTEKPTQSNIDDELSELEDKPEESPKEVKKRKSPEAPVKNSKSEDVTKKRKVIPKEIRFMHYCMYAIFKQIDLEKTNEMYTQDSIQLHNDVCAEILSVITAALYEYSEESSRFKKFGLYAKSSIPYIKTFKIKEESIAKPPPCFFSGSEIKNGPPLLVTIQSSKEVGPTGQFEFLMEKRWAPLLTAFVSIQRCTTIAYNALNKKLGLDSYKESRLNDESFRRLLAKVSVEASPGGFLFNHFDTVRKSAKIIYETLQDKSSVSSGFIENWIED